MNAQTMTNAMQMLPPQLIKQMGGAQGRSQMMKALQSGKMDLCLLYTSPSPRD